MAWFTVTQKCCLAIVCVRKSTDFRTRDYCQEIKFKYIRMNKLLIVGGIVLAAILLLVVLSPADDLTDPMLDTDVATTPDETMPPMPEAEPAAEAEPAGPTIVDLAVATEELSTLVTAVTAADLATVLASEGPFTVLAPQNSAFDALPAGTVESLLEPANVEQLQTVLSNHVISGAALSTDLTDGMTVTTLAGVELPVSVAPDGVVSIGGATVVAADVEASNGVVHIIDTVLVPPTE